MYKVTQRLDDDSNEENFTLLTFRMWSYKSWKSISTWSIEKNDTWELASLLQGFNAIGVKWVYNVKIPVLDGCDFYELTSNALLEWVANLGSCAPYIRNYRSLICAMSPPHRKVLLMSIRLSGRGPCHITERGLHPLKSIMLPTIKKCAHSLVLPSSVSFFFN